MTKIEELLKPTKTRKRPLVASMQLAEPLASLLPYRIEIYDSRSGPIIKCFDGERCVKTLKVSEAVADLIAEAKGKILIFPGIL